MAEQASVLEAVRLDELLPQEESAVDPALRPQEALSWALQPQAQ